MALFLGNGTLRKMKMISKTTFKLRSTADLDDLDGNDSTSTMGCGVVGNSSGNNSDDFSLELMEIPLSPTNYNQPPTPPGIGPPPPIVAELEISRVLDRIRTVRFHFQIQNIILDNTSTSCCIISFLALCYILLIFDGRYFCYCPTPGLRDLFG